MRQFGNFLRKIILSPPFMAAAASVVIMVLVLMVHPLIGMADNGDFYRSTNGQGIYKLDRYEDDQYFEYFSSKYGLYEYYNEYEDSIFSAQNLYIRAGKRLNSLISPDKNVFDIRCMSVILIAELAAAIYMLVDYITYKRGWKAGMFLGAVCVFIFTDTAYTAYFNSFYAEGIVYVSFLLLIASALLLRQKRYSPYALLASIIVNGVILVCTKQQNATEGFILFPLCIFIALTFRTDKKQFKKIALGGAVVLAAAGVMMYVIIPENFVYINLYHAMTRGLMMTSADPEKTLEDFGIDQQYAVLDGTIYFERYPAVDLETKQMQQEFCEKYGVVSVSAYYLTHPDLLINILNKAASNGYMIRPEMQGNYERDVGKEPGEKTNFFTAYSTLKKELAPKTIGFVLIWLLLVCALSFKDKKKLIILICAAFMGIIQVGTSIVGAGDADLAKHIFMYNAAFDLVSFLIFAPILTDWTKQLSKLVLKQKKSAVKILLPIAVVFLLMPMKVLAAPQPEEIKAVIICHNEEEGAYLQKLADACGLEAAYSLDRNYSSEVLSGADYVITTSGIPEEDIHKAGIPAVFLEKSFREIQGSSMTEFKNVSVKLSGGEYEEAEVFEESIHLITSTNGKKIGRIEADGQQEAPFAVLAEDGNYYIPFYRMEGLSSILLGTVFRDLTGTGSEGKQYFMIDEVYTFSDLEKVCALADTLYEQGIPFIVRIMPVYDNLEYPAFKRFTKVLRYLQLKNASIVIHPPLVIAQQTEREPLSDKMERFKKALEDEKINYKEFPNFPFEMTWEEIRRIDHDQKNFAAFPMNTVFGVTPENSMEECNTLFMQLNEKWMSISDYNEEFPARRYQYEEEAEQDYRYREEQEVTFKLFFTASDRVLLLVVGISLIILAILLIVGRKWYRRKFYR